MAKLIALLCSLARDEKVNASGEVNAIWDQIATGIATAVP